MSDIKFKDIRGLAKEISDNVSKVIVDKEKQIKLIIAGIFAGGHILIEDNPGTGKTMLAKSFAKSMDVDFKRVQFTPDLMPSDITGLNIFNQKESEFKLIKGPVFTNVLLADEINRATPRTQASLLEAMEEKQVTIDGETIKLDVPFIVFATENPVETSGTYPLPEAELDRFLMKLSMGENDKITELNIIERYIENLPYEELSPVCRADEIMSVRQKIKSVFIHDCVREYMTDIVLATRQNSKINMGVSSRGLLALVRCAQAYAAIDGRKYVEPDDVKALAPYVLGHRIIAFGGANNFKYNSNLIMEIVESIDVPVEDWKE
ncbi:MAG: MoxR family ATPase [Lachnospiraceae bacterium]|nr:MoxR family ATPase [Lachnospiraceae bacterium]